MSKLATRSGSRTDNKQYQPIRNRSTRLITAYWAITADSRIFIRQLFTVPFVAGSNNIVHRNNNIRAIATNLSIRISVGRLTTDTISVFVQLDCCRQVAAPGGFNDGSLYTSGF